MAAAATGTTRSIRTSTIIQMNDVWASYDSRSYALKGVRMSVERGANYAVVGASGSGKSTLVKLLTGTMRPSRGAVRVDYQTPDAGSRGFRRVLRRMGYIPQNLGLVRNLSVRENVLVGSLPRLGWLQSMLKSFPDGELGEADRILGMVGLSGKAERKAYMLSGGERRRVAIARALMQKPEILLADEILSELDHVTAREIMDLVADAQGRIGLTAVMVHHDLRLALEYASRVAVMQEGQKVLEIGVDGDRIVDFQTGNLTRRDILEMYADGPEE